MFAPGREGGGRDRAGDGGGSAVLGGRQEECRPKRCSIFKSPPLLSSLAPSLDSPPFPLLPFSSRNSPSLFFSSHLHFPSPTPLLSYSPTLLLPYPLPLPPSPFPSLLSPLPSPLHHLLPSCFFFFFPFVLVDCASIWWMERELMEKKKYMPQKKQK